jgi:predicted ABC-class ATPase
MQKLINLLNSLGGQGYKSYRCLQGEYQFPDFRLYIDHVQGDPFAQPSRCRLELPLASTSLPPQLYDNPIRRIALEDYLGRRMLAAIRSVVRLKRGSGRSGEFDMASYGQEVLRRSNLLIEQSSIEVRLAIGLPADNRRIDADYARIMLISSLPTIVDTALLQAGKDLKQVTHHINCIEDQQYLREQLADRGLIAFIADGSILARRSGVDNRAMEAAVKTLAPETMACEIPLKHHAPVRGIAFPKGINLIVGGGFHGKSTLLRAIEQGVYDHIPGDGRELVVSDASCFKLRAEDGRAITGVDIRPFINNLPGGEDCAFFTTGNASGSSSQAASIVEAISTGSKTLLIDEDTSATNFLIRDLRMQSLVPNDKEPITPLLQRIRLLRDQQDVSVVMVMGGSGDYFSVADRVVMMDSYQLLDLTQEAHQLADFDTGGELESIDIEQQSARIPEPGCLSSLVPSGKSKIKAFGTRLLQYGEEEIALQCLEQLVDSAQLLTIGYLIEHFQRDREAQGIDLVSALANEIKQLEQRGFDRITAYPMGKLALPRLQELVAVVNRMRLLELRSPPSE